MLIVTSALGTFLFVIGIVVFLVSMIFPETELVNSQFLACNGVIEGFFDKYVAKIPATIGQDADVPLKK